MSSVQIFIVFLGCSIIAVGLAVPLDVDGPSPPYLPDSDFPETKSLPSTSKFVNPVFDIKYAADRLDSGISGERFRWTNNGFYVHADSAFFDWEYRVIMSAFYEISLALCIPVLVWPQNSIPTGDYVEIVKGQPGSGCYSFLGRVGGKQDLNLQVDGCIDKAIIMHELIHALGYHHEQTRSDRDNYVRINYENIQPQFAHNFNIYQGSLTYGVPYDLGSIMHYGSFDFSANGQPTISSLTGARVGTQGFMTPNDIMKLRRMYNCVT